MPQSYKPSNMPTFLPYFAVSDAERAIEFYQKAFGFHLDSSSKDDNGNVKHAEMRLGDCVIMFAPESAFEEPKKAPRTLGVAPSCVFYVYCPDVDALYKQAMSVGAQSIYEPQDAFWGDRMCALVDPDGYEWSFGTHKG